MWGGGGGDVYSLFAWCLFTIPVPVTDISGRIADLLQSFYGDRIHIFLKLEIGAQNAAFQQKHYMWIF